MKNLIHKWNNISLIKRIICGLIIGIALGLIFPQATAISILGDLFVGALRGIAPLLVFFLIMSSLCRMAKGQKTNMSFIVILYLLGNLFSALSAVIASYLFPVTLTFSQNTNTQDITPPTGVTEVLKNLLMNVVANPVDSLVNANYIGILAWAIILGIALKSASDGTKKALENISDAMLDMSPRNLEKVLYFAAFVVTDPGDTPLLYKQVLSDKEYREAQAEYGPKAFKAGRCQTP